MIFRLVAANNLEATHMYAMRTYFFIEITSFKLA